jgi:hypothetical protein
MAEWRAAASHGHELGNHSLFHQCSHSKPDRELGPAAARPRHHHAGADARPGRAGEHHAAAIDGRTERTYTVPCGDRLAAGKRLRAGLRAAFVAIKAAKATAWSPAMATLDPYEVPVLAPVGLSGKELIAIVQRAVARRGPWSTSPSTASAATT